MPDLFSRIVTMYRNKVGLKPTAEEIITADEVKTAYSSGNRNRFVGHSVPADPSSRPEDQLSISCVPMPVSIITFTSQGGLSKRAWTTMVNMDQNGHF